MENMSSAKRRSYVKEKRLCFNCLKTGHTARFCPSEQRCAHCQKKHNTLLNDEAAQEKEAEKINVASSCLHSVNSSVTFLMTAIVDVKGGRAAKTRVLLDPGAQASFISEALVDAAAARAVGTADITVQGLGAPAHRMRTTVHQLFLRGLDGSTHEVKAF